MFVTPSLISLLEHVHVWCSCTYVLRMYLVRTIRTYTRYLVDQCLFLFRKAVRELVVHVHRTPVHPCGGPWSSRQKKCPIVPYRPVTSWKRCFPSRPVVKNYTATPTYRPVPSWKNAPGTWYIFPFRPVVFFVYHITLPSRPVNNLYPQSVPSRPAQTTVLCPHFPVSSSCFSPDKANQNRIPPGTAVLFVVLSRLRYVFLTINIITALINPFNSRCGDWTLGIRLGFTVGFCTVHYLSTVCSEIKNPKYILRYIAIIINSSKGECVISTLSTKKATSWSRSNPGTNW